MGAPEEEVGGVDVPEPEAPLELEPLVVWPVCVDPVPVEDELPVLEVELEVEFELDVDVLEEEPPAATPVPSLGLLGVAPPGLTTVEIPPVARIFVTVVVVVVVDVAGRAWDAVDGKDVCVDAAWAAPESCDSAGGVSIGVEAPGGASAARSVASAAAEWATEGCEDAT